MKRKEFIKICGLGCTGLVTFGTMLQGCASVRMVNGKIVGDDIIIPLSDFEILKGEEISFKNYVIVQNDQLQYPICVYRISETNYKALWMKCTHQGTELTAFGDKLQCSAHGSEFDKYGNVTSGPASNQLRVFPVSRGEGNIRISLKSI